MSQFPISYVSAETGINPITLRAWEHRYRLIQPTRTASGHRLYSKNDIDRIKQVLYFKSKGHRMSEMNDLLSRYPDSYNTQIKQYIPKIIQYTKQFNSTELCNALSDLISFFNMEEFADKVYPIILDSLRKDLWKDSIYFTMERCFFFDQMRNTLQRIFDIYQQDSQYFHLMIIGYEAPKQISEFYINNLFLAIQCSQNKYNTCLINHIDLFEELLDIAKQNPKTLYISPLGNDVYQFKQCIHLLLKYNIENVLLYHANTVLTDLDSEQLQVILPKRNKQMIGVINRRFKILD